MPRPPITSEHGSTRAASIAPRMRTNGRGHWAAHNLRNHSASSVRSIRGCAMKDEVRERARQWLASGMYRPHAHTCIEGTELSDLLAEYGELRERAGIERAAQEYECKPGWDGKVIHQRGMPSREYCEMCEIADNLRALATSEEK